MRSASSGMELRSIRRGVVPFLERKDRSKMKQTHEEGARIDDDDDHEDVEESGPSPPT